MKKSISFPVCTILLLSLISFNCRKSGLETNEVEISGIIEAVGIDIRAQVQGEVLEIFIDEGQAVQKGDILCRIDDEKLTIQLNQILAAQTGAGAKLRLFQKGTKKELIAVAKNRLEASEKKLELAKKDQERMAKLLSEGAVSEAQKEKADLRLKAAQESWESADENYRLASRGREKEEIQMVEAEISSLKARENFLRRQIQDTQIFAPRSGVIEVRHIEVGELALPGAVLFSLIDLDRAYVKAYVPERYIGRVRLGDRVMIFSDSFPDQPFEGSVDYIADHAEFAPKNIQTKEERLKLVFMIKAYLQNKDRYLKPGMPVDVHISLNAD